MCCFMSICSCCLFRVFLSVRAAFKILSKNVLFCTQKKRKKKSHLADDDVAEKSLKLASDMVKHCKETAHNPPVSYLLKRFNSRYSHCPSQVSVRPVHLPGERREEEEEEEDGDCSLLHSGGFTADCSEDRRPSRSSQEGGAELAQGCKSRTPTPDSWSVVPATLPPARCSSEDGNVWMCHH